MKHILLTKCGCSRTHDCVKLKQRMTVKIAEDTYRVFWCPAPPPFDQSILTESGFMPSVEMLQQLRKQGS